MALGRSPSAGLANPWSEMCIESATALGHYDAWCARGPPPGRIGGGKAMGSSEGRAERIEALRGLLERLCAPDLTLAEAKPLRNRLFDLLEQIDRTAKRGATTRRSSRRYSSQGRTPPAGKLSEQHDRRKLGRATSRGVHSTWLRT